MAIFASLLLKLASDPAIDWFQAIDWKQVKLLISSLEKPGRGNPGYPAVKS